MTPEDIARAIREAKSGSTTWAEEKATENTKRAGLEAGLQLIVGDNEVRRMELEMEGRTFGVVEASADLKQERGRAHAMRRAVERFQSAGLDMQILLRIFEQTSQHSDPCLDKAKALQAAVAEYCEELKALALYRASECR